MLKTTKLTGLTLRLGASLALSLGYHAAGNAQDATYDAGYQSNEKDAIYGDAPAGLDPVNLMHRLQQANSRNSAEFDADFQGQLDSSVSDYKRLQQQKILDQQQQQETTVVETEAIK